MTLFDIFYKHTNWWYDVPEDGGKDTYHYIIEEMEACASKYAKELRGIGDKWLQVIERESKELCSPNHYSYPLHGEKKKWHDSVRKDFLCHIRKAMQHYNGCDFCELPDYLLPFYGIYSGIYGWKKKKRVPEPQHKKIKEPKTFRDRIAGNIDADELIAKLHTLMDNRSGKSAIVYLVACRDLGKITLNPTYTQVINEFPQIGCKANYQKYIKIPDSPNFAKYTKVELEAAKKALSR